jgi:hypothetical protein
MDVMGELASWREREAREGARISLDFHLEKSSFSRMTEINQESRAGTNLTLLSLLSHKLPNKQSLKTLP